MQFPDGSMFKGMFKDDHPNGEGTKIFPDGSCYEGSFMDGMFHGKGKYK